MLIDAGESSNGASVVSYIKNLGIKKLDFVVATHPHADHIGGMATVINSIAIDNFYMPRKQHTTKTFENMLDALLNKNVNVIEAKPGVSMVDSKDLQVKILGPVSQNSSNINNYSAIIKIIFRGTSFLLVGDAETNALSGLTAF